MAEEEHQRLLVLRDPRDGHTVRLRLGSRDRRYFIDIDSGTAEDGTSIRDRWHPSQAKALKDLEELLYRYRHAGYQLISDGPVQVIVPTRTRHLD